MADIVHSIVTYTFKMEVGSILLEPNKHERLLLRLAELRIGQN